MESKITLKISRFARLTFHSESGTDANSAAFYCYFASRVAGATAAGSAPFARKFDSSGSILCIVLGLFARVLRGNTVKSASGGSVVVVV